jgi:hypothetical protein
MYYSRRAAVHRQLHMLPTRPMNHPLFFSDYHGTVCTGMSGAAAAADGRMSSGRARSSAWLLQQSKERLLPFRRGLHPAVRKLQEAFRHHLPVHHVLGRWGRHAFRDCMVCACCQLPVVMCTQALALREIRTWSRAHTSRLCGCSPESRTTQPPQKPPLAVRAERRI